MAEALDDLDGWPCRFDDDLELEDATFALPALPASLADLTSLSQAPIVKTHQASAERMGSNQLQPGAAQQAPQQPSVVPKQESGALQSAGSPPGPGPVPAWTAAARANSVSSQAPAHTPSLQQPAQKQQQQREAQPQQQQQARQPHQPAPAAFASLAWGAQQPAQPQPVLVLPPHSVPAAAPGSFTSPTAVASMASAFSPAGGSFTLALPNGGLLIGHPALHPGMLLGSPPAAHSLAAAAALSHGGLVVGASPAAAAAAHAAAAAAWSQHAAAVRPAGLGAPPAILKQAAVARQQKARKRNTVASLEAELGEKLAQLQLLSAENEVLKLRAGVLEATVANREDQMRVVWEHGPPTFPIDLQHGPGAGAGACRGPPSRSGSDKLQDRAAAVAAALSGQPRPGAAAAAAMPHAASWSAGGADAAAAGLQPGTPQRAAAARSAAAAVPGCGGGDGGSPTCSSSGSGATDSPFDAHTSRLPLTQQKDSLLSIKAMTDEEIIRHWKQFLTEVTSELVQLQREESAAASAAAAGAPAPVPAPAGAAGRCVSAAERRVMELVDKYCYLVRTAQTLNPSAYCRLFGRHLDTGAHVPYSDHHWRNVVAVLGLSKDQMTHILACAELYFSSRAKLQAEQRALQGQLRAAEASPNSLLSGPLASEDNPLRPWLERLANNLKREHNLRIMLNSYVWGCIFTHVQKAKAAVYSHPLYVDIHALVCVMCEDALAAAGAPRGAAAGQAAQQQAAAAYASCQQHLAALPPFAAAGAAGMPGLAQHVL